MRLFGTDEYEAIDSATPRKNVAKMPHCKIYNPMMELTTVRVRERVCCTYGIPIITIGLPKHTFLPTSPNVIWYSEWGMRGWSVLGSVPLMGSTVSLVDLSSSWLAGYTQNLMHYFPT